MRAVVQVSPEVQPPPQAPSRGFVAAEFRVTSSTAAESSLSFEKEMSSPGYRP